MNRRIDEFLAQFLAHHLGRELHRIIALHEAPDGDLDAIDTMTHCPCHGWIELAQLPKADRKELVQEYWLCQFREYPRLVRSLLGFFDRIDEVGIYITKSHIDDPWEFHMIYELCDTNGYFRGSSPANPERLLEMQSYFKECVLPPDYLAFLQIHDGFAKATDTTGITASSKMIQRYEEFQRRLENSDPLMTSQKKIVDPKTLIPFYESFGMPFYQCFWTEWHPEGEMGNIYYSPLDRTIDTPSHEEACAESMAFATFGDWLLFYLEQAVAL